jgi:hypothetical protein
MPSGLSPLFITLNETNIQALLEQGYRESYSDTDHVEGTFTKLWVTGEIMVFRKAHQKLILTEPCGEAR